jgi:hypothetical protein
LDFLSEKFLVLLAVKALMVVPYQSFCHFLGLIQESNQRKSRKNNASPRKLSTRTPLFFPPHAHGILFFDDFRTTKVLPFITFILNRRSIGDCITRKGVSSLILNSPEKWFILLLFSN